MSSETNKKLSRANQLLEEIRDQLAGQTRQLRLLQEATGATERNEGPQFYVGPETFREPYQTANTRYVVFDRGAGAGFTTPFRVGTFTHRKHAEEYAAWRNKQ